MRRQQTVRGRFGVFHAHVGYDERLPTDIVPRFPLVCAVVFYIEYADGHGTLLLWLCVALILATIVWFFIRLHHRSQECERLGHEPYRPVPHLSDLRCFRCLEDLPADYPVTQVQQAAQKRRQSYYSDRR